jgi:hypothetical protein
MLSKYLGEWMQVGVKVGLAAIGGALFGGVVAAAGIYRGTPYAVFSLVKILCMPAFGITRFVEEFVEAPDQLVMTHNPHPELSPLFIVLSALQWALLIGLYAMLMCRMQGPHPRKV